MYVHYSNEVEKNDILAAPLSIASAVATEAISAPRVSDLGPML
jgi:hypothetical protein